MNGENKRDDEATDPREPRRGVTAGAPQQVAPRPYWWPEWLRPSELVAVAGLLGVVTFVVINLACLLFYGPLGLDSADAGLGYDDLLAQSGIAIGLLGILVLGAIGLFGVIGAMGRLSAHRHGTALLLVAFVVWIVAPRLVTWWLAFLPLAIGVCLAGWSPIPVRTAIALTSPLLGVMFLWILFWTADGDRVDVQDGQSTGKVLFLPPPWKASVAEVTPLQDDTAAASLIPPKSCFIYLGENDGTAILYNSEPDGSVVRVAASEVIIETPTAYSECGS